MRRTNVSVLFVANLFTMVYGANIESKEEYEEACRVQPLIEPRLTYFWTLANRVAEQRGWTIGVDFMIKV